MTALTRHPYTPLAIIAGLFAILCLIYARATPIMEASDELWHMGMVQFIAENGRLPIQDPDVPTIYEQEGSQPPLYYALAALIVRPIDRGDFAAVTEPNPHPQTGVPGACCNKNLVLHDTPLAPAQGTALAVYVLRGFSALLSVGTLAAVYNIGWQVGGRGLAILAAGITAFNPMFVFISASVNNDNLVTMLNSWVLWLFVVMLWRGFDWRRSLAIAVLVTLASLSKLSGNVLVPVIAVGAAYIAWRTGNWRGFVLLGVLMAGVWAVGAGWWYWRNIVLYGELFGTAMMVEVAGPRLEPFTLMTLVREFEGFRIAYWGLFGGVNVLTFPVFYTLMDGLTLAAVFGFVLAAVRSVNLFRDGSPAERELSRYWLATMTAFVVVFVLASISLIAWTAQTYASQGRLLFPFVGATSVMLASGLLLLAVRQRRAVTVTVIGVMGFSAAVIPFVSIAPAYAPPRTIESLPAYASPAYARFESVEMIGYRVNERRYTPGDDLPVTVYWRVIEPDARDLSAYLWAIDPAGEVVGKIDTYPGGGTLRTSTWEAGAIYTDRYAIPLAPEAEGRFDLRVLVGWWHYPTEHHLTPLDSDGTPLADVVFDAGGFAGPFSVDADAFTPVDERVRFGGQIDLRGWHLADDGMLRLWWGAARRPDDNYTVFVQVLDDDNTIAAQGDAPPPLATDYWRRGDESISTHALALPDDGGPYRVIVGWYRPDDFQRLPLPNAPDDAYTLITLP